MRLYCLNIKWCQASPDTSTFYHVKAWRYTHLKSVAEKSYQRLHPLPNVHRYPHCEFSNDKSSWNIDKPKRFVAKASKFLKMSKYSTLAMTQLATVLLLLALQSKEDGLTTVVIEVSPDELPKLALAQPWNNAHRNYRSQNLHATWVRGRCAILSITIQGLLSYVVTRTTRVEALWWWFTIEIKQVPFASI